MLEKILSVIEERRNVYVEYGIFPGQMTFDDDCMEEMWTLDPTLWWLVHRSSLPMLQSMAIKLFGQPCSLSSAERNWSTYDFIHSLKGNIITPKRAENLVFVYSNLQLLSRSDECNKRKNSEVGYWR